MAKPALGALPGLAAPLRGHGRVLVGFFCLELYRVQGLGFSSGFRYLDFVCFQVLGVSMLSVWVWGLFWFRVEASEFQVWGLGLCGL